MIFRLIFNKWTFFAVAAYLGNKNANHVYEEATFTKEEQTKIETPNSPLTKEEKQAIEAKKALQKEWTYKAIAWYQGAKASALEAGVKKLKELREKVDSIR